MQPEVWRQAEELFHAAADLVPEERSDFLHRACGSSSELRRQVELLLSADGYGGSLLRDPIPGHFKSTLIGHSLVGRQLGCYRIVSFIGAGGMGEVYRGHDDTLGRDVAIKTLPYESARDPLWFARLRREARILAALNHSNIASIYGLEESEGLAFLVLEMVEGDTLHGPLPVATALDIASQVAEALVAAHDKGIIHRDLKPTNIKVTPHGKVKVLDFGLAKENPRSEASRGLSNADAATGIETLTGIIIGTPAYMSPEQARGREVDERADHWAFGCLLYELLTGRRAFAGSSANETIAAVLEREPDWQALPIATPPKIRELLRRCLEKDAGRRPARIRDALGTIEAVRRGRNRLPAVAISFAAMAVLASGIALRLQSPDRPSNRSQWVQLTRFPDPVSQPALSPDGRMLAFLRSPRTDFSIGELYVKRLPDGEPVQLTHDRFKKTNPAFSPDGTRVAYSVVDAQFRWSTWVVPTEGGEPRRFLSNAGGLVWAGKNRLLFSEIRNRPLMAIVTAREDGTAERDVYQPQNDRGQAERAYPSPDGNWVLVAEVGSYGNWEPCRVVPMEGGGTGRQVGPPGSACTSGAWSPDGKWVYVTSKAGGLYHIWRQRFPDGQPQQLTSGLTEEEGVAMATDGRSFVTAVALESSSLWIHDAQGERQISVLEGNAAYPKFSPDGTKLCYRIVRAVPRFGTNRDPGEVWVANLASGISERVAPGFEPFDFDISWDGKQVVMESPDRAGKPRLWLATLGRREQPRQIPNVEGRKALFGPDGEIFFRRAEGPSSFVYRVRPDGTGLRRALEQPVLSPSRISPDGRWIEVWAPLPRNRPAATQVVPINGGPAVTLGSNTLLQWSPHGGYVWIAAGAIADDRSYLVPLPEGRALPSIPAGGFRSEEDVAGLPGAQRIDALGAPGPSPDVYAFERRTTQRNLYRIPAP